MKYGEFLVHKKLATEEQINEALNVQRHSKLPLGKLAVKLGYVSKVENIKMLIEQDKTHKRYGDIAIGKGLLDDAKIAEILKVQQAETMQLGKILVESRVISRLDAVRALAEYTKLVDTGGMS